MFSATRMMRTASIGWLFPMMAIAARGTPGAQVESLWQYDEITDTGYYGFVPASVFITGLDLTTLTGFTSGTNQNSDAGWLKFYVGPTAVCNSTPGTAKCLFIAKQSFKYRLSWNHINSAGLVRGTISRIVRGQLYNIRIMTGGGASRGPGSEWNELIYRVHAEQPEPKSNWETFDTIETNITSGHGRYVWCQETSPTRFPQRVLRGRLSLTRWNDQDRSWADITYGWRPVLEYVPQ